MTVFCHQANVMVNPADEHFPLLNINLIGQFKMVSWNPANASRHSKNLTGTVSCVVLFGKTGDQLNQP